MWLYILLGIVAVIAGFVVFIASRPSEFRTSRSAKMAAPPSAAFDQVNNLRSWDAWSPWAKLDPDCKNTYEGPSAGKGAKFHWAGNNQVGEGRMEIIDSRPSELVRLRLDFLKPFKATNTAEFTFKPEGGQTNVTWSMFGRNNFMFKAMGLFMNCDKMVGGQFEQGLANMKSVVEHSGAAELSAAR
jgi:polyketide cyclase/dehydrase/lipid transport protein